MELTAEVKLVGDACGGGFACGMSLVAGESVEGITKSTVLGPDGTKVTLLTKPGVYEMKVYEKVDGAATRIWTKFKNTGDKERTLELLSSFDFLGVKADKFYRLQTFWSAEGKLKVDTIEDLHLEKSWSGGGRRVEKFGTVGSMPVRKYFPFIAMEDTETGEFTGILMGHASSWQIEISCKESQTFEVMGGIADRDFGHWMKKVAPGENFVTPDALVAKGTSLEEVCDKLVKAQHPAIASVDTDLPIIYNEYCTSWGNPTLESIKKQCDTLEGKDIQYFVIDAGWYGLPQDWVGSVGNWAVNRDRFPNGLKEAADYIKSKGWIPGLWFELECVGSNSPYFHEVDHVLKKDGYPLTVGGRRFLDMEDPWVIDHLTRDVIGTLKEGGFGYLKIDYNDTIGMGCDGGDDLGEALYRKVQATRGFIRKIKEEIPGIVIEICSSGGHRLVYSMLELGSQASFSDAHETVAIPIIAANMHRVIQPRQSQIWSVLRAKDDDNRLYYSLASTFLGRMCLSGDIYDLSEEQMQIVDAACDFYRLAADIIKNGKTTVIDCGTKSYNKPQGQQLVIREYEDKKLVIYHRFENSKALDQSALPAGKILAEFGKAEADFSAYACIVQE